MSLSQALGMDSVMGRVTLNHLSVLQNEGNGCKQAGTPVRRQPRRMPAITSWETDEETVETVSDFIFLGSKITADGDCSHETS